MSPRERLAKLAGGVAVVRVGCSTRACLCDVQHAAEAILEFVTDLLSERGPA